MEILGVESHVFVCRKVMYVFVESNQIWGENQHQTQNDKKKENYLQILEEALEGLVNSD